MRYLTVSSPFLLAALAMAIHAADAQQAAPTPAQYQALTQSQVPVPAPLSASNQGQAAAASDQQAMPPAPPEEHVEAVRLSDVEGSVRLTDSTGKLFDQVRVNMAMFPGMRLEAGGDGRAEIQFPDGTIARVTPNSAVDLVAVTRDDSGHAHVTLRAAKGLSYYELAAGANGYVIQIGPLVARPPEVNADGPAAATLLRVSLDTTPYEAAVLRGSVHFEDQAGENGTVSYDLQANQTAKIDPQAASNYDVVGAVTPDTWDTWNSDRDAALAQIASNPPLNQQPGGPGWSDLDYYGSWYNVPGQGMAWAPDGVDQSFDPYGAGAWSYYSGVGYSWVSAYPWGWLPYHCGLWNYYGTYGWMWQPAHCGWGSGAVWFPYSVTRGRGGYHFPLHPNPPRGINRVPLSQALVVVNRGEPVRFRGLGEPRPAARPAVIAGESLQPEPVSARPGYGAPNNSYRSSQDGTGSGVYSVPGSLIQPGTPGPGVGSRIISAPARTIAPTPRYAAPPPPSAPRMSAPAVSAPHTSAPSSSGHH